MISSLVTKGKSIIDIPPVIIRAEEFQVSCTDLCEIWNRVADIKRGIRSNQDSNHDT